MYDNFKTLIVNQKRKYLLELCYNFILLIICILLIIFVIKVDNLKLLITIIVPVVILWTLKNVVTIIKNIHLLNKYNIYKMNMKDISIICEELDNIIYFNSGRYILTSNYIISLMAEIAFLKYTDIILMCEGIRFNLYSGHFFKTINIIIKNGKKYKFDIAAISPVINLELKDISEIILKKNPNVLVGKTKENKKILLEKYNIKLK